MFESLRNESFWSIARRYFVVNGFDGILTVLGITAGSFSAGVSNPLVLITSGLGAGVALGVSGVSGAYITEKAERTKKFKDLQKSMLSELRGSVHRRNVDRFSLGISAVNGASPFFFALLSIIPYFLALYGWIEMGTAYCFSIGISMSLMGFLGGFLGKISKENILVYALKMVGIGVITALLCTVLGLGA